jgi:DNA polymerase I-like protein with 3'-5' exonuclease and polymerase domains
LYPEKWRKTSEFRWWLVESGSDFVKALNRLEHCDLISVDTETVRNPRPAIELVQYTGFKFATNESWTYVVPMNKMEAVKFMRQANALDVPKVLQNGKYDCAYFFAYSAPLTAYYYDLKNAMHAQYSELPKDLAFSSSIWIREIMYWKDLSSSGDSQDKFRYGALDTWATGEAFIAWLEQAPDYAKSNYLEEFLLVPSLHMCEMRGIKRDMPRLYEAAEAGAIKLDAILREVRALVGSPRFNPSSPDQCVRLICAMTGAKLPDKSIKVKDMTPEQKRERQSSAEKAIVKASYAHPLNERVLGKILEYRGLRKELSTYLPLAEKAKEFGAGDRARILYSLNPDGTDSGRLASKSHHFWCGLQIQNISSDGACKSTLIADEGFHFGEADYSQAEDRGVAFSSGDPALLDIFERGVDSHSFKAAMFFGIPYEEIYDVVNHKVLNKGIRQLGKRINHGANYNMGAQVLLETMGPKATREAQRLLKLPARYTLIEVCKYLLLCYEKAFPTVKTTYYTSIKLQIKQTKMMVSDTGWVRYCFGDPEKSKPALNKYVAHRTQNLNAMILNKAWLIIFKELGFNPNFKLLAQIHDSILFQYRIGHEYLAERVKELMTFPVPITDCKGITRDLIVPVDIKLLGRTWAGTNE